MSARVEPLSQDEIAQACFACGLAIVFWNDDVKRHGRSDFAKAERDKYLALSRRLNDLLDKGRATMMPNDPVPAPSTPERKAIQGGTDGATS